jgi:hypothetical protein
MYSDSDTSTDSDDKGRRKYGKIHIMRREPRDVKVPTFRTGYLTTTVRRGGDCGTPYALEMEKRKREEIDEGYFRGRESPPTLLRTNKMYKGGMIPIGELLFQDNRYFRPKK